MIKKVNITITVMATAVLLANCTNSANKQPTDWVNPFLGTATLWEHEELRY